MAHRFWLRCGLVILPYVLLPVGALAQHAPTPSPDPCGELTALEPAQDEPPGLSARARIQGMQTRDWRCLVSLGQRAINRGELRSAVADTRAAADMAPAEPLARCVAAVARLAEVNDQVAQISQGEVRSCEPLGLPAVVRELGVQCLRVRGEPVLAAGTVQAVLATSFSCEDHGSLRALADVLAQRAGFTAPELNLLARHPNTLHSLTDAAITARLLTALRDGPPTVLDETLRVRGRALLGRLLTQRRGLVTPADPVTLAVACGVLGLDGHAIRRSPAAWGEAIATLSQLSEANLLDHREVAAATNWLPLGHATDTPLRDEDLSRLQALVPRLTGAPELILTRLRLQTVTAMREPEQSACNRGEALFNTLLAFVHDPALRSLAPAVFHDDLDTVSSRTIESAAQCVRSDALVWLQEARRIHNALGAGASPAFALVGF